MYYDGGGAYILRPMQMMESGIISAVAVAAVACFPVGAKEDLVRVLVAVYLGAL